MNERKHYEVQKISAEKPEIKGKLRILVVEDEKEEFEKLAKEKVEYILGYPKLDICTNYADTMKYLETHNPDGIISDLTFPLQRLKKGEKRWLYTREEAEKIGFVKYLEEFDKKTKQLGNYMRIKKFLEKMNIPEFFDFAERIAELSKKTNNFNLYSEKLTLTCSGDGIFIALEAQKRGIPYVIATSDLYHSSEGIQLGMLVGVINVDELIEGLSKIKDYHDRFMQYMEEAVILTDNLVIGSKNEFRFGSVNSWIKATKLLAKKLAEKI